MQLNKFLFLFTIFFAKTTLAQQFILPNEELIFSFETKNGKKVVLAKAKNNDYIIYRFGPKNKVEFEFPDKTKDSWSKIKYSFYLRGGGPGNEGMDLNYIHFSNKNFGYIIYDTYYAVGNKHELGIKVLNGETKEATVIRGINKTRKGTLTDLRDNNLITVTEEILE